MLIDKVKVACRVTSIAYEGELLDLIESAYADLGIPDIKAEVLAADPVDPLIRKAVITYCRIHFGHVASDEYVRLKASYDEQKAQLLMSSSYTEWGDSNA